MGADNRFPLIASFLKESFVDWDKGIVAVIFLRGCNFRCPWCHNYPLVFPEDYDLLNGPFPKWEEVKSYLKGKGDRWLDGVLFTGGEPLLHFNELREMVKDLKEKEKTELKLLLDTNGSFLSELVSIFPYFEEVRMDIKAPLTSSLYGQVTGSSSVKLGVIEEVIRFLAPHKNAYFRTTPIPSLVEEEEIMQIATFLGEMGVEGERYSLNSFRFSGVREGEFKKKISAKVPFWDEETTRIVEEKARKLMR